MWRLRHLQQPTPAEAGWVWGSMRPWSAAGGAFPSNPPKCTFPHPTPERHKRSRPTETLHRRLCTMDSGRQPAFMAPSGSQDVLHRGRVAQVSPRRVLVRPKTSWPRVGVPWTVVLPYKRARARARRCAPLAPLPSPMGLNDQASKRPRRTAVLCSRGGRQDTGSRILLNVADTLRPGFGRGIRGQTKFVALESTSNFRPLEYISFLP